MHQDVFYLVGGLDSRRREPGIEMHLDLSIFNTRLFDFNTQTWTQVAVSQSPNVCDGVQLVALGDQLILFGGTDSTMHCCISVTDMQPL